MGYDGRLSLVEGSSYSSLIGWLVAWLDQTSGLMTYQWLESEQAKHQNNNKFWYIWFAKVSSLWDVTSFETIFCTQIVLLGDWVLFSDQRWFTCHWSCQLCFDDILIPCCRNRVWISSLQTQTRVFRLFNLTHPLPLTSWIFLCLLLNLCLTTAVWLRNTRVL